MNNSLYYPIVFLLCHLIGDYWLQSDWCAMNKSKKSWPCLVHVLIYTACFLLITTSWKALLFIGATHFILDRFHIILKKMIYWKNHFPTLNYPLYGYCDTTGYYDDSLYNSYKWGNDKVGDTVTEKQFGKPRHFFITMWLYIISDNIIHLICNLIALTLLK
jgi:hypothetical protein